MATVASRKQPNNRSNRRRELRAPTYDELMESYKRLKPFFERPEFKALADD